jgi:hypothetical protein
VTPVSQAVENKQAEHEIERALRTGTVVAGPELQIWLSNTQMLACAWCVSSTCLRKVGVCSSRPLVQLRDVCCGSN